MTWDAHASRLRSVLTQTESSTGSVLHSRCPDILLVPHMPQGVRGGCSMSARIGMPPDGARGFGRAPVRDRFQKTGLPASCAGKALVLSQVNPELVV